jgi:hypothetical protein
VPLAFKDVKRDAGSWVTLRPAYQEDLSNVRVVYERCRWAWFPPSMCSSLGGASNQSGNKSDNGDNE